MFLSCGASPKACQMRAPLISTSRVSQRSADTPLRAVLRFRLQRLANQPRHRSSLIGRGAAWAQFVMQPGHILLQESPSPLAHRRVGQSHLTCNLHFRLAGGTQQNNPGSAHQSRRKGSRTAMPSSCSCCSGRRTKAAFGRPITIDTPHFGTGDVYIPSNTIATYLWDITLGARRGC